MDKELAKAKEKWDRDAMSRTGVTRAEVTQLRAATSVARERVIAALTIGQALPYAEEKFGTFILKSEVVQGGGMVQLVQLGASEEAVRGEWHYRLNGPGLVTLTDAFDF
ncbi:MAG: hypothetical protein ACYDEB_09180 [Dehalococcoidia bacterium]